MRSLFILDPHDLNSNVSGGVQLCSREFLDIVRAASDTVDIFEVSVCRHLLWRLRRRFNLGSYLYYNPAEVKRSLIKKIEKGKTTHVFINRCELLRLTPLLRELLPDAQIIIMSHGNQSGDDLYELSGKMGRRNFGLTRSLALWKIGQDLGIESWYRHRYVDVVCVMSKEEESIERWLGAKKTIFLPRTISVDSVHRSPVGGRVGFVGTLNHTPNRVALEEICKALSTSLSNIELRLVGRPETFGQNLASRYNFVTYLGALDELALRAEVSTWRLFLNPVFWLSRGASMKLGKAISWKIPYLTTRSGARGYELDNAHLLTTSDVPGEFVNRLLALIEDEAQMNRAEQIVMQNQVDSPTIEILARRLSSALNCPNGLAAQEAYLSATV